ncbi:MAG: SAM-dependent methyltransferase [Clostridia bacterium]|nr:SAM-dependent methyltransferase [Clostridia bacterium]
MDSVKLSPRLTQIFRMVGSARRVADIGSDHALLPIALCQNDRERAALASDINEGPCARARENIAKFNLTDRIAVACRPGLQGVDEFAPDCVVIAGMGGEMVASILAESDYPRMSRCRLILQPMSMQDVLRRWLCGNGFAVSEERVVFDDGKYYQIIAAAWDGVPRTMSEPEYRLGALNLARAASNSTDTDIAWLRQVRTAAERRIEGRKNAASPVIDQTDGDMVQCIDKILNGVDNHANG